MPISQSHHPQRTRGLVPWSMPRRQQGAAIIAAMLVTATVATLAAAMLAEMNRWFVRSENERNAAQAQSLSVAALKWSAQYLAEEARLGPLDHLGELWASGLPATPVEGGNLSGVISDMQAKYNLNNIVDDKRQWLPKEVEIARDFLRTLAIPAAQIDAIFFRISQHQVAHMSEFPELRNTQADAMLTVLPTRTSVNLNTASLPTLTIIAPGIEARDLADRAVRPFTSSADFLARTKRTARTEVSVASRYFQTRTTAVFGHVQANASALIDRTRGIVWQLNAD